MKNPFRWVFWALITAGSAVAAPTVPDSLTLDTGYVLHTKELVSATSEAVVVKHSGGVDRIAYRHMAPLSADTWKQYVAAKEEADRAADEAQRRAQQERATAPHAFHGQMFIATKGAGSYKLGGVQIEIVSGTGAVTATTDADGKFEFTVTGDDPFILNAAASRQVGYTREIFRWTLSRSAITDPDRVLLTQDNAERRIERS